MTKTKRTTTNHPTVTPLLLFVILIGCCVQWCASQQQQQTVFVQGERSTVPILAGGLTEIKTDDPEMQEALAAVRPQIAISLSGTPTTRFKIVKVLKAHSQVVAGTKYYVKFKLSQPRQGKPKLPLTPNIVANNNNNATASAPRPPLGSSPSSSKSKICRAQIHVMRWVDYVELLSLTCHSPKSSSRKQEPQQAASSQRTAKRNQRVSFTTNSRFSVV